MTKKDMLCIMISQLSKNNELLSYTDITNRFQQFYNTKISDYEVNSIFRNLQNEEMLYQDSEKLVLTKEGLFKAHQSNIEYYFSEGVKCGQSSKAEYEYQKRKGISQQNDSMLDQEQFKYILTEVAKTNGNIIDLGCGKGGIASCIQQTTMRKVVGIDKSKEMLKIAKFSNNQISWVQGDLNNLDEDYLEIGCILLIDSIYFSMDYEKLLHKLQKYLAKNGSIIIAYSEYSNAKPTKTTKVEAALEQCSLESYAKDFTINEISIWESRREIACELRNKYLGECNEYLYYDKLIEATKLLKHLKNGNGVRKIYTALR